MPHQGINITINLSLADILRNGKPKRDPEEERLKQKRASILTQQLRGIKDEIASLPNATHVGGG